MRAIPEPEYNRYMKSAAWVATKRAFLYWCRRNKRSFCWFCGELDPKTFQVHHVRYENFGMEKTEDLSLICTRCHTKLHNSLRATVSFQPTQVITSEWMVFFRDLKRELRMIFYDTIQTAKQQLTPPNKTRKYRN